MCTCAYVSECMEEWTCRETGMCVCTFHLMHTGCKKGAFVRAMYLMKWYYNMLECSKEPKAAFNCLRLDICNCHLRSVVSLHVSVPPCHLKRIPAQCRFHQRWLCFCSALDPVLHLNSFGARNLILDQPTWTWVMLPLLLKHYVK